MNLVAPPALADKHIWMLHDGRRAIAVDPGNAAPVVRALEERGLKLAGIVVTPLRDDGPARITAAGRGLRFPCRVPVRASCRLPRALHAAPTRSS